MPLIQRKSDEERAQAAALKEQQQREADELEGAKAIEKAKREFFTTPAGRARIAYDQGDQVFQYAIDVMNQKAIIVHMVGSTTSKSTTDPVDVLNSVCREGWELLNGSFVFIEEGHQSRDKMWSTGQNVAIKGTTVGYYLFRRCEANRAPSEPWIETVEIFECETCGTEVDAEAEVCPSCGRVFDS